MGWLLLVAGSLLAISATHAVTFGTLSGVGMLVRRAFGLIRPDARDWFVAFWMGLAATTLFLLAWNFLFAVNLAAFFIVVTAGLMGLWPRGGTYFGWFRPAAEGTAVGGDDRSRSSVVRPRGRGITMDGPPRLCRTDGSVLHDVRGL
jgi:hypothetical protein